MTEAMYPRGATPAEARPAVTSRRSRDLEPWEGKPLSELGLVLESARLVAGLTLEDLGPVVGPKGSLEAIERGRVRTRASRLRPWLLALGVDPGPVIQRFSMVIAPERPDGKNAWRPVPVRERRQPDPLALPPLAAWAIASFGAELWRIRCEAGLTRTALAARLQVSRITIWRVERGTRRPSAELLDAWLEAVAGPADRDCLAARFPGLARSRRRRTRVGAPLGLPAGAPTHPHPPVEGDPR